MTVDALRAIKQCAIAIVGFVAVAVVFIILFGDKEDRPAGFFYELPRCVGFGRHRHRGGDVRTKSAKYLEAG